MSDMPIEKTGYPVRRPLARLDAALYREPFRPYYVTIRCREWCPLFRPARVAEMVADTLRDVARKTGARLGAYCVMPDHVHFLAWFEAEGSLFSLVRSFKSAVTRNLRRDGLRESPWQHSFYDHICRRSEGLVKVCEYILAYPVRKNLCQDPAQWPWGGLVDPLP